MDRNNKGQFVKGNRYRWSSTHQPHLSTECGETIKSFDKTEYINGFWVNVEHIHNFIDTEL
ncbi:unnamed protein product [marine sediment metagenome]|uniref:Uncharacterized protein n=1 Tax=marine sediment metagenome TaxID=412755 RepID=X1AUN9_9ZZZZ